MRYLIYTLLILSAGSAHAQTVYRVHLKLEGMIDPGVAAFVERVIAEADETEADAIVFEIDTFGGRVDAATVIRDAILDAETLTIAFINKRGDFGRGTHLAGLRQDRHDASIDHGRDYPGRCHGRQS